MIYDDRNWYRYTHSNIHMSYLMICTCTLIVAIIKGACLIYNTCMYVHVHGKAVYVYIRMGRKCVSECSRMYMGTVCEKKAIVIRYSTQKQFSRSFVDSYVGLKCCKRV